MLSRLLSLAVGCRRVRIPCAAPGTVTEELLRLNVPVWGMEGGEGAVFFFVSLTKEKKVFSALEARGFSPVREELFGLPRLVKKYSKRFGFFLGLALFALFTGLCSSLVWEVRVIGAEADGALMEKIALAGVYEGMRVFDLDETAFRTAFLAQNPDFTFASAAVIGSTAVVRLNARTPAPELDDPSRPANLVAVREGVVVRCEAARGIPLVTSGDCVAPGQILVSGISETPGGAYTLHRSEGRVLARTKRRFETQVAVGEGQKRYTGELIRRVSLVILGKNINIFDFSGNPGDFYDTIEEESDIVLFGVFRFPFSLAVTSLAPYRADASPLDRESAERILYDRYHEFLSESLGGAQIIASEVSVTCADGVVKLCADLSVIEDIAVVSEIGIADPPG